MRKTIGICVLLVSLVCSMFIVPAAKDSGTNTENNAATTEENGVSPEENVTLAEEESATTGENAAAEEGTAGGEERTETENILQRSIALHLGRPRAFVNGEEKRIDPDNAAVVPFEENNRTYVPLRFLGEALGAEVTWEESSDTAVLKNSSKTVTATNGEKRITVNGEAVPIDVAAVVRDDRFFLPLRAVANAFDQQVFWDARGLIVLGESGEIPEAVADELVEVYFKPNSSDIVHPYPENDMRWMLTSSERAIINLSEEDMQAEAQMYMDMTLEELKEYVDAQYASLPNRVTRPAHERISALMARLYQKTQDEEYAERAIMMIYRGAVAYPSVPDKTEDITFHNLSSIMPSYCIFAYDNLYNSPYWEELSSSEGVNAKQTVEGWFCQPFEYLHNNYTDQYINNLGGYWIKHMAGTAVILNNPDMVRDVFEVIDNAMGPGEWHGDGMWSEGTFSYGQQFAGNNSEACNVFKLYVDPYGYVDTRYGLTLNKTDVSTLWPIMLKMIELNKTIKFPDGSAVAVHDTHHIKAADKTVDMPILEEYMDNFELNHFGLYGLKHGDTEEAQQMNLKMAPQSEGLPYSAGHYHGDFLGFSLWSAGMEILPDGGYVFNTQWNRYLHMNAVVHNVSWVSSPQVPDYSSRGTKYTRPNLLAYDDGLANGKQVQLIEGSQPQTEEDLIDIKRRLLLMVATDKNHSYTVDIQRLKGGTIHENFLRQVEEEDVEFETDLALGEVQPQNLGEYLKSLGLSGGIIMDNATYFTSPQGVTTSDPYTFSWKGKTSGTTMTAHIKGNPNATIAFSQFPTMRRVTKVEDKDKFPGYHMYQRLDVSPSDITIFGGVYEGTRADETTKVKSVEWLEPEDKDPMTTMLKVQLDGQTDYIYISNDTKTRSFENMTFSGACAIVRKDDATGEVVWSYLYGEGGIDCEEKKMTGEKDYLYKVLDATGSFTGEEIPNTLQLKGTLPESVKGLWGHTIYADGSGHGFQIMDVDSSTITLNSDPGFELTEEGAQMKYYPMYENIETSTIGLRNLDGSGQTIRVIPGEVWFEVKVPTFIASE